MFRDLAPRRLNPRRLTPGQRLADGLIAVAYVLLASLVPGVGNVGNLGNGDTSLLAVVLLLGAALAVRRWSPPLALGIAWVAAVTQMLGGTGPVAQDAAIPPIIYACAAYGSVPVRWAAFTSALVGSGVAGVFTARGQLFPTLGSSVSNLRSAVAAFVVVALLTAATLLLSWTLGLLVSTRRQSRANRQDAENASREVAAEQERTRIARDMHDVVAHSLAVVIAQSDGARLVRHVDPDAVDEALDTIGATARAALADVRVLLQQLRYEGTVAAQPGLADLETLAEQFRASGLDVRLQREGDVAAIGTTLQLAAFRIVQESLTNALRHGDTTHPADVRLSRDPHGLDLEITSALPADRAPRTTTGHGLIGMQERAATVQGHLTAAPDGARFVVRAWLPLASTATIAVQR